MGRVSAIIRPLIDVFSTDTFFKYVQTMNDDDIGLIDEEGET